MKAIVFDLGITIKDLVEKPILHDYLQVSPIKVLLSGLENSIYTGILWIKPKTILGSTGIVRIEAVGIDVDKQLEGKNAIVLPFSKKYGGVGTEIDGILAEKAVIPDDVIVPLPKEDYSDKYILYPFVSIGLQARKILKGLNVLIIGDGLTGLLTAYMLVGYSSRVALLRENVYKAKIYGVEEIKEINQNWDCLFITTMRSWPRALLPKAGIESFIVMPRFLNSWPAVVPSNAKFIEPIKMNGVFEFIDNEISEKMFNELVGISDDIISSIPTPKPGVIVNIKNYFMKSAIV